MSRNYILKASEAFSFLERGKFYWRLIILPFVGAFIAILSYEMGDETIFFGNFLSFSAIFYSSFLFIIVWIASSVRDKLFASNNITLILLWPISKKEKMFWLYLRTAWLPGALLLFGAIPVVYFIHSEALNIFLTSLPYGLAAGFFLSIINWKGSYTVTDAGSFVGKISVREENYFFFIFFICLSPVVFDFFSFIFEAMAALFLLILGFVYKNSTKQELQSGGGTDNVKKETDKNNSSREKKGYLSFFQASKSAICRYFYYLEWDTIKKPLQSIFTNIVATLFITITYYTLEGFFSSNADITIFEREINISFLLSLSSICMYYAEKVLYVEQKPLMLLPVSYAKKAVVNTIQRIFLPSIYTFLSIVFVSLVIGFLHRGLSLIITQPYFQYKQLFFHIFTYTMFFFPLAITFYSLLEFFITALKAILQGFGFFKISSFLYRGTFFLYLGFLLSFAILEDIISLEIFLTARAMVLYIGLFFLSRVGLYWAMKRVQVISS